MPSIVKSNPLAGTLGSRSNTITTGGSAKLAASGTRTRRYLFIMNPQSETEDLWFSLTADAAIDGADSIPLEPGASFEWTGSAIPDGPVSVTAATTGHAYIVWEII